MNKKFSTLVAGLLLATSVGTVSAQDLGFTKSGIPSVTPVETVADGRCYQLVNGTDVLVMQKITTSKGDRFVLKYIPSSQANVGESLWYIKVVKNNNENGVAFKFMNLAYNYPISFDPAKAQVYKAGATFDASYLSGDAVAWAWMRNEAGAGLGIAKTPEAYFKTDSVMTLVPTADGTVAAVKYDVRKTDKVDVLKLRPAVAAPVWLNKNDLNSMLQTQELEGGKVAFSFEKDVTDGLANLWSSAKGHKYEAVAAVGENTLSYGSVQDAKEDYELADAEFEKAGKALEEAAAYLDAVDDQYTPLTGRLRAAKSDREKADLRSAELTVQAHRKGQEINTVIGTLATKENELVAASTSSEAQKESVNKALVAKTNAEQAVIEAQEVLGLAQNAVEDAENARIEAEEELSAAKEKYNLYFEEPNNWANRMVVASETCEHWLSYMIDPSSGGYKYYIDALSIEDKDKETFDAFLHEFYDAVIATSGISNPKDPAMSFMTEIRKGRDALKNAQNKAVKAAEDKLTGAEAVVTAAEKAVKVAEERLTQKEKASEDAEKHYNECVAQLTLDEEKVIEIRKKIKELEDQKQTLMGEFQALYDENEAVLAQIRKLNEEIDELNTKLALIEPVSAGAWVAWQKANAYYNTAATTLAKLYRIYLDLDAEKSHGWLSLKAGKNAKGQDTYLMVDTAYLNGSAGEEVAGIQHLGFAIREHVKDFKSVNNLAARDINGRFNFRFRFWPTQDSLRIEADGYNTKNVTTKYWKDRTNSEIDVFASTVKGYENNLVKIAVLGGARREATIGSSEELKGTGIYTYNDRIGLNLAPAAHDAVLEPGIYFMDVVNGADAQKNGARLMGDLEGWKLTKVAPAEWDVMDFEHMPAAKWIVDPNTNEFGGYPEIWNQETGNTLNNGSYKVLANGNIVINYYYYNDAAWSANDTLKLTKTVSNRMGFFNDEAKNVNYTLNYLNVGNDLGVTIGNSTVGKDTILRVSADEATTFELVKDSYSYHTRIFEKDTIFQSSYLIRVNDPYKFANNHKYVQVSNVGGTEMMVVTEDEEKASTFRLKEVNCIEGVHYYALLTSYPDGVNKKAGVIDATGLIKAENVASESTTSAFALVADTTALYREFTAEELGEDGAMKFYRVNSTAKAYLYEGADNLLCVEGKGDDNAEAFNVIPTGVKNTLMPQYLIAKDVNFVAADTVLCDATTHAHATKEDALQCSHSRITADTTFGRFLVNMIDSVLAVPAVKKYTWEGKYKRLAFLPGYIANDTLTLEGTTKVVGLSKVNQHDAAKFAFRLVNEGSNDFLIESESYGKKTAFDGGIAPSANLGGWVKAQNGVPVIINDYFEAAMQSDLYNVDTNAGEATANDDVTVSEVKVIAGEGQVTVAGAAGKKVVITNILGQTVANKVITSDNAVIAAPAGVVVVAVEGEEAVKAIVK